MNRSQEINELAKALVAAQAEMRPAELARTNPHFHSKFAGLPEVRESAKVLHKHGLAYTQDVWTEGENCEVACCSTMLMHVSGQWKESPPIKLKATPATPQGVGSALTYARRYSLSAQLAIVADEDDDGNAASEAPARSKKNGAAGPDANRTPHSGKPLPDTAADRPDNPASPRPTAAQLIAVCNAGFDNEFHWKNWAVKYSQAILALPEQDRDAVRAAYKNAVPKAHSNGGAATHA